jgi:RNA-directed DNA polymerase
MGLELKPEKTRISHTLEKENGRVGFDFLGFAVRQFRVNPKKSGTNGHGQRLGFTTLIQPSTEKQKQHSERLRKIVRNRRASSQEGLIAELNPIIRGWSNYYHTVDSKKVFRQRDHILYQALWSWARFRHSSHKGKDWIARKYWRGDEGKKSLFKPKGYEYGLARHAEVKIKYHTKVKGEKSPFDGDWRYWSARRGAYPGVSTEVATLLKKQQGKCQWCKAYFGEEDLMEVDHIIPHEYGGGHEYANKQLLHRHCHDTKSAQDLELYKDRPKVEKGKRSRWKKFSRKEKYNSKDDLDRLIQEAEEALENSRRFLEGSQGQ